jgi:uncharacterized protein YndB with AHSA1/START domain
MRLAATAGRIDVRAMRFSFDQVIQQPLTKVYPYLAEPRNRPTWQSTLRRVDMLTKGPPGRGTRWRERAVGFGTSEMEIIAFEPNRVWGEHARSAVGEATITLYFEEEAGTPPVTRVRVEAELALPRLLGPVARLVMTRLIRSDLARAERILQSA